MKTIYVNFFGIVRSSYGIRAPVKNQLHGLAMSQGVCRRSKLWNAEGRKQLENLTLDHWAGRRRDELLQMLDQLGHSIEQLSPAVEEAGQGREDVRRLLTHAGVGRIVALAFSLTIGHLIVFLAANIWSVTGAEPARALERWPSKVWDHQQTGKQANADTSSRSRTDRGSR